MLPSPRSKFKRELAINMVVIGQMADILTTVYGIKHRGWREANPIMNYVINHVGLQGAAAGKLAFALAVAKKRSTPLMAGITWLPVINNLLL